MRLTSLALLFTTGLACGPDKNDTETSDGSTAGTSAANTTGDATGSPTTGGETEAPTTGGGDGTGPATATGTGTGETGETGAGSTGEVDGCEVFQTQESCERDPNCMAVVGEAFEFAGCMPGQTFIACMPMMPCDAVITNICEQGTGEEVYRIPNGCVPPGFASCLPGDFPLCSDSQCEGLPEQGCFAAPNCTALTGAPHMEKDGEICVDFGMQEFLACAPGDLACPPSIATVCPEGQPGMVFDTPSGCIPPGFVACDMPAPECQ